MKKRVLAMALAIMMMAALVPVVSLAAADLPSAVGKSIAGFDTKDTNGNPVDYTILQKYQLTLLNYWATWCNPCKVEMPDLQKFYEKYKDQGINLMGILLENDGSTVAGANNMMAQMGLTYTCLRVDSVLKNLTSSQAPGGGVAVPDTYLIDSEGNCISAKVGSFSSVKEIEDWVLSYYKSPDLDSATLPETATLEANRMLSLKLTYEPQYAMIKNVTWKSSDEKVATVNEAGLVTGIAAGTTTITAEVQGENQTLTATCKVTVTEAKELEDGTAYYAESEVSNGNSYRLIVNSEGRYYMMTNEKSVAGRYRLEGKEVAAENIVLPSPTKADEPEGIKILDDSQDGIWIFEQNSDGTYYISSQKTGEYLSTIRANGVYRLGLKTKPETKWNYKDGILEVATEGAYTLERKYLTFYADADEGWTGAFDLLDKTDENFKEIDFYGRYVQGDVTTPPPSGQPIEKMQGDLNGNGKLDAADATIILRYLVGVTDLTDEQKGLADMNGNKEVDVGDASLILRKAVGM